MGKSSRVQHEGIAIESKRRSMGLQLGDVFDFDVFPFKTWRWIIFDGLKHDPVELRCFYFLSPVCIYLQGSLQYFQ